MLMIYLAAIEMDADKLKFEVIYQEYRALMFYVANQILKNEQDAEDVVHQAFLNVIEILDKIEAAKCPKTKSLLVIIVKRKAIDLYRRQHQRTILPIDEENGDISGPSEIEGLLEQVDFARAMASLSAKYRELLLLKYDSGYSDREIAQILSMSESNVKKTIQRAKAKLEEMMKEREVC